ncbi:MAG: septum formation initiator family protein [Specibacter sp.]
MATRRPKVPSAQFSAGAKNAPGLSDRDVQAGQNSTTAEHGPRAHRTTAGAGGSSRTGHDNAVRQGSHAGTAPRGSATKQDHEPGRGHHEGVVRQASTAPVPARSFSGRLLVIGLAMAAITVVLAPNVHTFMEQRAEISDLKQVIAEQTAQQAGYKSELARWDDPAYVKQQARDRVSMLMPGETGYWVYGANGAVDTGDSSDAAKAAASAATSAKNATVVPDEPWVDSLFAAIQKSSEVKVAAPAKTAPAPKAAQQTSAK